jgi:hypothetical protein
MRGAQAATAVRRSTRDRVVPCAPMKAASAVALAALAAAACNPSSDAADAGAASASSRPAASTISSSAGSASGGPSPTGALDRGAWNQKAARLNLPVYWVGDKNADGRAQPDEVRGLLFYPSEPNVAEMIPRVAAPADKLEVAAEEAERRRLVGEDLDQGRVTLVESKLGGLGDEDKALVRRLLVVARKVDELYSIQTGMAAIAAKVPKDDAASQSLFRRNWGARCMAPKTEKNAACSAIPGAPKRVVDVYPAEMQADEKFCEALEKDPASKKLLDPFVVVRKKGEALAPVPYTEAYKEQMAAIAADLRAAADGIASPSEAALKAYLTAAAKSFGDNDWRPADEAWAKMNAKNSKFYLRVGPDETYWEPCNQKAGFHFTFARINPDSLEWQNKLTPVQQDMEKELATLIGAPYQARKVSFHLPDFIDIVWNAGDDRNPTGATIGQSLPNWGPVANEGRGRTVAMTNLYADPDSLETRRRQAESLLTKESLAAYADTSTAGFLATILHEAAHNLGPAHEYRYQGKKDSEAFGGQLSSMLEELKAQSAALWYVEFARKRDLISAELARQTYVDSIVWALGHISRGMTTATGGRQPYSQLAAIQVGFLVDEGAITFDPRAPAANGTDQGAFSLHLEKFPAAVEKLMKVVGSIKASNDKAGAEALATKYVDGPTVPHKLITERELRYPKASFVYALEL